jgi:hypothetical protein
MRDVDMLVRPDAARRAAGIFFARGFVHGEIDKRASTLVEIPSAAQDELMRGHYEFLPFARLIAVPALDHYRSAVPFIRRRYGLFVRGGHVFFRLAFDLHFNLLLDIDPDVWWRRARPMRLQSGARYHVLDPADALWFLSTRVHAETMQHGEQSMRGIIDVAACLARFRDRIDWQSFRRTVAHAGLLEPVAVLGSAIDALVPGIVPTTWPRTKQSVAAAQQFATKLVQSSRQPIAIRRARAVKRFDTRRSRG